MRDGDFLTHGLRERSNFYLFASSHDKHSLRISPQGVRSGWRNALPMRLRLEEGEWEMAMVQLDLQNVQRVFDLLYVLDDNDVELGRYELGGGMALDGLAMIEDVHRTLETNNANSMLRKEECVIFFLGDHRRFAVMHLNLLPPDAMHGFGDMDYGASKQMGFDAFRRDNPSPTLFVDDETIWDQGLPLDLFLQPGKHPGFIEPRVISLNYNFTYHFWKFGDLSFVNEPNKNPQIVYAGMSTLSLRH